MITPARFTLLATIVRCYDFVPTTLRFGLVCTTLACALPYDVHAQDRELPKKEISEKTGSSLAQLRTLTEAKDYVGSLVLIDRLLTESSPDSFDAYVLNQIKAQILLTQNRLEEAITPLETALRLGESNANFYDAAASLEQLNLLAQLYYQRAAAAKSPSVQRPGYEQAYALMSRWLERSPRPTVDARLFAASVLYQLATLDSAKPDADHLRATLSQAREGMLLAVKPPSQLLLLLVASHLSLGDNAAAIEHLELLAQREPKNSTTWSQLQSLYLAAAAEAKDPEEARRQNIRALVSLDRAQAQGQLNTLKENYTRVAILFNLQQFNPAAILLEKGLADGTIENNKRNWELLGSAYQQTSQGEQALSALTRAVAKFPDDAALEFSLAQMLYGEGQVAPAYARAQSALRKGLEKPGQAQVYLAYLAYELQNYEEAQKWVEAARASGGVPASTLDPLAKAISDALRDRAALKQA
jgi:tetratricopeptide (TPR) repeat protein